MRRGYRVTTWMSCFSHHTKSFRAEPWSVREIDPNWKIVFVPATAYRKNIDVKRLTSEMAYARNLYRRTQNEPAPDCIVVREPPQIAGHIALRIGREKGVKVISDVYDLWPEFFHQVLPSKVRRTGKALFSPYYRWRKRNWDQSDGVCALAKDYLQRALDVSPALHERPHRIVYNGIDVEQFRETMSKKSDVVPKKTAGEIWAVYAGTMGNSYDVSCMVSAAKILGERKSPCRLMIAGTGPLLPIVQAAHDDPAIPLTYLGKLPQSDLLPLYRQSDIGLCAYAAVSNVEMPDKFYDYSAAGLPIVNSLTGEVATVMEERQLGLNYRAGSAVDLADKIQSLVDDPKRLGELGANSWDAAMEFDAIRQFDGFVDLIERVMGKVSVPLAQDELSRVMFKAVSSNQPEGA